MSVMIFNESAGIKTIASVRDDLLELCTSGDEVVLDFSNLDHIDFALAQLILSARKYLRKNRISLKLKNASDNVRNQLALSGVLK